MTDLEQFIEDNEVYFVCQCGNKHGIVESFQTVTNRIILLRAGWYDTAGVFFDPAFIAEGAIIEITPSDEWKVGETVIKKCSSPAEDAIIAIIQAWRTFKGATPKASRDEAKNYILDSFQPSFVRESDLVTP